MPSFACPVACCFVEWNSLKIFQSQKTKENLCPFNHGAAQEDGAENPAIEPS